MSGLMFIILRSAKNTLLELRHKPGKLILYIFLILVIIGVVVINATLGTESAESSDILYLKGIIFAFFMLFFVTSVVSGLSQGSSMFGMDDVNLLFVSPINPRSILLYGVFRVVKTMALTSIFILFQGSTLRSFGIETSGLAILYAGYLLTTVVTQILSLFIYSTTNGRPKRQRLVKILAVLMFAPLAVFAVLQLQTADGNYIEALRVILASPVLSLTPLLGWASAGIIAFLTGNAAAGALYIGLLFLLGAALVAIIYIGKPDYYEDVLVATETAFEQKRNLSEGKINTMEQNSKRRIRVKGTGVGGQGASVFFYKHLRESFRANRFGLWGMPTILMTVGSAGFILIVRNVIGADGEANIDTLMMLTMLFTLMWIQIFFIGTSRGLTETYNHYIYMIPESPFKKMVYCNLEVMLKALVDGALICTAAGIVAGVGVAVIALSAATYALFVFLLISVNYVSMRFTGADVSAGLLIFLYMLAVFLVMAPGIVLAIIAGVTGYGTSVALIALSAWELVAALACFWASKGILHNCDMASMRQTGK